MLHLKVHLTFHFKKHKKLKKKKKKFEEKDEEDGSLDNATKDTPLNLKFGSLRVIYISYSTEQTELLTFSN